MVDPGGAVLIGSVIVAGSIWWLQRDRTVSFSTEMHLSRKEDDIKKQVRRSNQKLERIEQQSNQKFDRIEKQQTEILKRLEQLTKVT